MARDDRDAYLDAQPRNFTPRLGRVHDRILDAYALTKVGQAADAALRNVFSRARDLGPTERAEVGDILFGLLRNQKALERALLKAAKEHRERYLLLEPPIRQRLEVLAYRAFLGASLAELEAVDAYAAKRIPGQLKRLLADNPELVPAEGTAERTLPDWMHQRLTAAFGAARAELWAQASLKRAPITLRVNRVKISRDVLVEQLNARGIAAEPTKWAPDGLHLPPGTSIQGWPEFNDGQIEIQDEGSQLVALATGARPGLNLLDACAGAGGKTLSLAAMMQNQGRTDALNPDEKKLNELKKRLRRAGVTNAQAHKGDLLALPAVLKDQFDIVLVDAPCTGTGTLRRSPDLRWRVQETDLAALANRQQSLLVGALGALAPGGLLVYATCSLFAEENEQVISELLKTERRLSPQNLADLWGPGLSSALGATWEARIGPGPTEKDPDGFYVAALRRD